MLVAATGPSTGVWDMASGEQVLRVRGERERDLPVPAAAFSPDGRRVAIGCPGAGETVEWELPGESGGDK